MRSAAPILPALDLILEEDAVKGHRSGHASRVADAYASVIQWPLDVRGGVVFGPNAPTAGPPPFAVFGLSPTTVYGLPGVCRIVRLDPLAVPRKVPVAPFDVAGVKIRRKDSF